MSLQKETKREEESQLSSSSSLLLSSPSRHRLSSPLASPPPPPLASPPPPPLCLISPRLHRLTSLPCHATSLPPPRPIPPRLPRLISPPLRLVSPAPPCIISPSRYFLPISSSGRCRSRVAIDEPVSPSSNPSRHHRCGTRLARGSSCYCRRRHHCCCCCCHRRRRCCHGRCCCCSCSRCCCRHRRCCCCWRRCRCPCGRGSVGWGKNRRRDENEPQQRLWFIFGTHRMGPPTSWVPPFMFLLPQIPLSSNNQPPTSLWKGEGLTWIRRSALGRWWLAIPQWRGGARIRIVACCLGRMVVVEEGERTNQNQL
jgi:hypothetical protein